MASALIALVGSIVAGLATSKGPPDLATLFYHTPNISEITTLLSSYTYRGLYSEMYFPQSQGLVTILAPNNAAFAKLPFSSLGKAFENNDTATIMEVLRYHVLRGAHPAGSLPNGTFEIVPTWLNESGITGGQVVGALQQPEGGSIVTSGIGQKSSVVNGDLFFNAGIVHVIDTFLILPLPLLPTVSSCNLNPFAGAIIHASLSSTLASQKNITIFAPSNAAFSALGSTLEFDVSESELSQLLQYHIVNGTYGPHGSQPFAGTVGYNSSLANGTVWQTLQGGNVTITQAHNSTFANSAKVIRSDILLANGVMHIIDDVLDYNTTDVKPILAAASRRPVIQGSALEGGEAPFVQYSPDGVSSASIVMDSGLEAATQASSGFDVSDIGKGVPTATLSVPGGIAARGTGNKGGNVGASASHTRNPLATGAGMRMPVADIKFVLGAMTGLLLWR